METRGNKTGGGEMKQAAAYIRVSTEGQAGADKYGLEAQKADIRAYAQANGFEITAWYKDNGKSGALLHEREGLQELLSAAKAGQVKTVIIAKMDRLARDLFIQLFCEKELKVAGCEIISACEPVNGKDPMQTAFRQLMGTFAELEKALIASRLAGGRKQKAQAGGYAGGRPAIGYKVNPGTRRLEIDQEKAPAIKRAFELRLEGYRLQQIADRLNSEGFTTARGAGFKPNTVKRILDRKLYAGRYEYAGIEAQGKHQAIINP